MTNVELEEIAERVSERIRDRFNSREVLALFNVTFLTRDEAAEFLRVEPATVSSWISRGKIPVRYAGDRPVFLLAELLDWTLPQNDQFAHRRLSATSAARIAAGKLTAREERKLHDLQAKR